jgi:hypothetical protein
MFSRSKKHKPLDTQAEGEDNLRPPNESIKKYNVVSFLPIKGLPAYGKRAFGWVDIDASQV